MEVIYTGEKLENDKITIFLAGPTPRKENVPSWREEAIEIFKNLNFDEALYVPELKHKCYYDDETGSKEMIWDQTALESSDIVMFWMPRSLDMLGLSTNVEFGYCLDKKNIIYGRPDNAMRCEFLDFLYKTKLGKDANTTLENTISQVIKETNKLKKERKVRSYEKIYR